MLVQYKDPTNSVRRVPYQKQADGTWKKLKDPADKGGDDNMFYEDKWAMLWNVNNSIKGFDEQGCAATCHLRPGQALRQQVHARPRPDRRHLAREGRAHGARRAGRRPVRGRHPLRPQGRSQRRPQERPGRAPATTHRFHWSTASREFMNPDGKPGNAGGTYGIKKGTEVPFVDNFKAGDEVASLIINGLQGDRADVKVATNLEQRRAHRRGEPQAGHRQQVRRAVRRPEANATASASRPSTTPPCATRRRTTRCSWCSASKPRGLAQAADRFEPEPPHRPRGRWGALC